MTHDDQIFRFELDFAGTLHCIPMVVRLKLDLCGVKLSLRQWNRFDLPDRRRLIRRSCESASEIAGWRAFLVSLIALRAGEQPVTLPIDPNPPWDLRAVVPGPVAIRCEALGLPQPTPQVWAAMTRLQRFTLIKLTSGGRDNDNFEPALREFASHQLT